MGLLDSLTWSQKPRGFGDLASGLASQPPSASYGESGWVSSDSNWMVRGFGGGKTDSGQSVSEWTAITLPVVYACVSIIADTVAQLPVNVFRAIPGTPQRPDGGREVVADHPLQIMLRDQPNPDMGAFVYFQSLLHHTLLWGNGFSEIERKRSGQPVALWPLYPDRTRPRKIKNEYGGRLRYVSRVDGESINLPADDVLHVPALGFDGYLGYSPVTVARNAVGMALAMEKFGGKFFANDSRSGGFLMHPGKLGDPAKQNVAESFKKQGGADNAFTVKVLEEGMKFIPTTIPPDDAQFLSSREFQVAEIARIYRVPLVMLQSHDKTTSWGSGIEQLLIAFVVHTIQPWIVRLEQELDRKLLTEAERAAGLFIRFNLNALLRGDMRARGAFYTALFNLRSINPNEIRSREDMNPYDGGDEYGLPPASATTDPASESPDDAPDGGGEDAPPPGRDRNAERDGE